MYLSIVTEIFPLDPTTSDLRPPPLLPPNRKENIGKYVNLFVSLARTLVFTFIRSDIRISNGRPTHTGRDGTRDSHLETVERTSRTCHPSVVLRVR